MEHRSLMASAQPAVPRRGPGYTHFGRRTCCEAHRYVGAASAMGERSNEITCGTNQTRPDARTAVAALVANIFLERPNSFGHRAFERIKGGSDRGEAFSAIATVR